MGIGGEGSMSIHSKVAELDLRLHYVSISVGNWVIYVILSLRVA